MHLRTIVKQILPAMLVVFFLVSASRIFAQVVPAARERGIPLSVGIGLSDMDLDYGKDTDASERRMFGMAAWVNFDVPYTPKVLTGLGLDFEGKDINYLKSSELVRMRQDTWGGGPIYTYRHFQNFQPYVKFLIGTGSIDFPAPAIAPNYKHDTRTVYAPGGGLQYRAFRSLWVRGDYEYQWWPMIFGAHHLDPNGYTFGVFYDFRRRNSP